MPTLSLETSAIRRITHYVAAPVETCDRCSAGIKYVFLVTYRDGETQRYGSECINKILNAAPTLRTLFAKNAKLLQRYKDYEAILSGPIEAMPRGQEYFGSGLYLVADSSGRDITFKHYYFHPEFDQEKNADGEHYVVADAEAHRRKSHSDIQHDLPAIRAEIDRLELFLARILRSVAGAK